MTPTRTTARRMTLVLRASKFDGCCPEWRSEVLVWEWRARTCRQCGQRVIVTGKIRPLLLPAGLPAEAFFHVR